MDKLPGIAVACELLSVPPLGSRQAGLPPHWVPGPDAPLVSGVRWAPSEEALEQHPLMPPGGGAHRETAQCRPSTRGWASMPQLGKGFLWSWPATLSVPWTPAGQLR